MWTTPVLVLLHNGFDTARTWEPVLKHIPHNIRIIAYDRQGYGSRFFPGHTRQPADIVEEGIDELSRMIDSLVSPDRQVYLWGHCVGGAIALAWAGRNPGKVHGIIGEAVGFSSNQKMSERAGRLLRDYNELGQEYQNHFEKMHGKNARDFWDLIRAHKTSYIMDPNYTIVPDVVNIRAPVLLLQGDRDIYFTPEDCEQWASSIPRARVRLVSGGMHDLHSQNPEGIANLVMQFLESV